MTQPTASPTPAPLDLHKYGRPELAAHIQGVLAVQRDIGRAAGVVCGGILLVWLAATMAFSEASWLVWGGVVACASFAAFELLSAASAWWVLRSKLGHAIAASELVVEICADVVNDIDAIAERRAAAPSPAEIVHGVFATLVHPIVLAQASSSLIGRLLAWLYTRHTDAVEQSVINHLPAAHEPLPVNAVGEQRHRIASAGAMLQQARDTGVRGLRHLNRHVLPAIALAALSGSLLQVVPLATTTAMLASDSRAPKVTGALSSPAPLIDPATGEPACAVLLEASYHDPTGRVREDGTPQTVTSSTLHVAKPSVLTVKSTGERLELAGGVDQPWASNQLHAGGEVPTGSLPDFLPAELRTQSHLRLRSDALPCGETHTLYGTASDGNFTLETAPPLPAVRVLGGLFLLYLTHQFGAFPVMLSLFYAAAHILYLVYLGRRTEDPVG